MFLSVFAEIRKMLHGFSGMLFDFPHHLLGICHFAISGILYTFVADDR
jgi:hypothetical protein